MGDVIGTWEREHLIITLVALETNEINTEIVKDSKREEIS